METIIRQEYLDKIYQHLGKETIIVLVGQRRVGKSCVLKMFCKEISRQQNTNIIYIDKEKRQFDFIKTYEDLNVYIDSQLDESKHNYILIDEVQDIIGFEHSVRSYRTDANTEVIITGSNSKILSNDLSTLIGGRYKRIYIQPLSYTEFLHFHQLQDTDDNLARYIRYGGLPGLIMIGLDEENIREYQMDIYHTALLKDVMMRYAIRNANFMENLVRFLADNSGKLFSANNVSKYMKGQGVQISPALIINYIDYLCEAFIIHKVSRFDIHGKRLFESNDKYYFEDHGIRNAIAGGTREGDIEKVMENVVYQHLLRLGYDVTIGQLQAGEIDFVASCPGSSRIYIQVSYLVTDEETRKREFGNLMSIHDNYPKYLISMTPLVSRNDYHGIIHLHLREFLTKGL